MQFVTLKKREEFVSVAKKGRSISAKGLILQALDKSNEGQEVRVGFTVSKKVSKKAVDRNRIKRRLRALVQEADDSLKDNGSDYVLIGRKETLTRPFVDLVKDFKYAICNVYEK